ncbi:MAG: hypothetical protein HYZ28_27990 [Myxococcales bacterium]|nr:hypothetical protein [Myxococcales bacterium]
MDPIVSELLGGPKSAEPAERLAWMKKVHFACVSAQEASIKRIGEPLKKAVDLLGKSASSGKELDEQGEAELTGLLLQAQGLALFGYLQDLNKVRNAIAQEASRQQPGSEERKKAEKLQGAYEQAIDGLARAYEGLRSGKFDELKKVGPLLEQARKTAESLR